MKAIVYTEYGAPDVLEIEIHPAIYPDGQDAGRA